MQNSLSRMYQVFKRAIQNLQCIKPRELKCRLRTPLLLMGLVNILFQTSVVRAGIMVF